MNQLLNDLLGRAAETAKPGTTDIKQATLAETSELKKAALGGYSVAAGAATGKGAATMTQGEADARNLTPAEMAVKYGQDVADSVARPLAQGANQYATDVRSQRDGWDTAADTVTGVGLGMANALGGIAALGTGIVNKDAGLGIAKSLDDMTKFGQSTQTPAMQAHRRALAATNQLDQRDSTAQFEKDLASGSSNIGASLARIGRDALSSVKNGGSDATTLSDGIAQGVGSMLGIGPVSGILGRAGGAVEKFGIPLAIGAIEAGGSYQQTANQVMGMTHEQLMANSPDYAGLVAQGVAPVEAQKQVASNSAKIAAAITLPAAVVAGKLVDGFAAAPFKVRSGMAAVGNLAKETTEEGIQGGAGQIAQNFAIQSNADKTQQLSEGVGEQIGTGALYGLGTAGAVQAPSLAAGAAKYAAVATLGGAAKFVDERVQKVQDKNDAASPNSLHKVQDTAAGLTQNEEALKADLSVALAPVETDTPEQAENKVAAQSAFGTLMESLKLSDVEKDHDLLSPAKNELAGVTDRMEAINKVASAIRNTDNPNEAAEKSLSLLTLMEPVNKAMFDLRNVKSEDLPDEVKTLFGGLGSLEENIVNSPQMSRAMGKAQAVLAQPALQSMMADMELTRENVNKLATIAQVAPNAVPAAQVDKILKMAQDGTVQLTPTQKGALDTAKALMEAAKAADESLVGAGLTKMDTVGFQVKTGLEDSRDKAGTRSGIQHATSIAKQFRNGDVAGAAESLRQLGLFAQSQANKVQGINDNFAGGQGAARPTVQVLSPSAGFKFVESKQQFGVTPTNPNSLKAVQTITAEAKYLAQLHNYLADGFPELGAEHVPVPDLDAILQGDVNEVAAEFNSGKRTYGNVPAAQVAQAPAAPKVEAKATPLPTLVEAPASDATMPARLEALVAQTAALEELEKLDDSQLAAPEDAEDLYADQNAAAEKAVFDFADKLEDQLETIALHTRTRFADNMIQKLTDLRKDGLDATSARALARLYNTATNYAAEYRERNGDIFATDPNAGAKTPEPVAKVEAPAPAPVAEKPAAAPKAEPKVEAKKPEPAPKVEPKVEETAPEVVAESEATPVEEPKTIAEHFPDLLGQKEGSTSIANAFKLRKNLSRFFGSGSPIAAMREALSSPKKLVEFLGKDSTDRQVTAPIASFYGVEVPALVSKLAKVMNKNLQAALNDPKNGLAKEIAKGNDVTSYMRGKALSMAQQTPKGIRYNQELTEAALMAALNWMMSSSSAGQTREASDIATLLGMDEESVSPTLVAQFNNGLMTKWDVVPHIAAAITDFWGMTGNKTAPLSDVEGIPASVAAEVVRAMIETGLLGHTLLEPGMANELVDMTDATNRLDVFELNHEALGVGYEAYPTLMGELAKTEQQEATVVGSTDTPLKVAKTQMNSQVPLTENQQAALEAEQKTEFFVNRPVADIYQALGKDFLLEVFANGDVSETANFNQKHLEAAKGKNISISAAFDSLLGRLKEVGNVAMATGAQFTDVPVRFAYGMSKVGRMQMLGRQNPQASKLVREALMPNWATIDMTNPATESYQHYMLSLAQMMGVKVHTIPLAESINAAQALLDGKLKPAVDAFREFHETGSMPAGAEDLIAQAVKDADGTFMGMHAMIDYARLTAKGTDKAAYRTAVYVEADGVTNGPINAMVNLTSGLFTVDWLTGVAKGGLFLVPNKTMNEHRSGPNKDSIDLYSASTIAFAKYRKLLATRLAADGVKTPMDSMMGLISMFNKDVTYKDGEWELSRGIAKNPLTITIYGSGTNGIASKIMNDTMDKIYAAMTAALQKQALDPSLSDAEAMFGDKAGLQSADQLYDIFKQRMAEMTTQQVIYNDKTGRYMHLPATTTKVVNGKEAYVPVKPFGAVNLQKFELSTEHMAVMARNMKTMFVEPMSQGIEDTIGSGLVESGKTMQAASGLVSIAMSVRFKDLVAAKMQAAEVPKGKFLSREQLDEVTAQLLEEFPIATTPEQKFQITKTIQDGVNGPDFGRGLDDSFRLEAQVFGPGAAGVLAVPMLNIGMGDGLMMQVMATMDNAIAGTLKIFDGVNIPVDKIAEGSAQANKAVSETWKGNPLRAIQSSYKASLGNVIRALEGELSPTVTAQVQRALAVVDLNDSDLTGAANVVGALVDRQANEIDARHAVLADVAHSIDQMASAGQPFQNAGQDLSSLAPADAVNQLNEMFKEKMGEVEKAAELGKDKVIYTPEGLLREIRKLPADLFETAKLALRSGDMRDYTVTIADYAELQVLSDGAMGTANGVTMPGSKKILLASTNPEVMVHELVHAATFNKVEATLEGRMTDPAVVDAVTRLQALYEQFLTLDQTGMTVPQVLAYRNAINSMKDAMARYGEASALNEFMAWATTNTDLIEAGKKVVATPNAFVKMGRAVVNLIRSIFLGSAPSKLPRDFFNAVRFNNAIVMNSTVEVSPSQALSNAVLEHSTAYGNDVRLNELETTYADLAGQVTQGMAGMVQKLDIAQLATDAVQAVSAVFPMNQQEQSTFQTIVGALASTAKINPASMAKAQEVFNYVAKQLSTESFMSNPEANDPADRFYAEEKFNMIVGKGYMNKDAQGRSTLLPVFIALASVDSQFRDVLGAMDMPKAAKAPNTTMDEYLTNYGTQAMEALNTRLSGVDKTGSVRSALDSLNSHIQATAAKKVSTIETMADSTGSVIDKGNAYVADALAKLTAKGAEVGGKLLKSNSKTVKAAGAVVQTASQFFNRDLVSHATEGVLSALNTVKGRQPLRDLANDIIGRVGSNASVYDMIKKVRSTVAAMRQEYRDSVPAKLAGEFDTKPTDEQWASLHKSMGKTDLTSLDFAEAKSLLGSDKKLAAAVTAAENQVKQLGGRNGALLVKKSAQLANYMNTGVAGSNLLRNADAVARLLNETSRPAVTQDLVDAIDRLATLQAMQGLAAADKAVFNELANDKGLEFTFDYLNGQRQDEVAKARANNGSKLNYYKGYIPTMPSSGETLIIADDSQFSDLVARSFTRVGSYDGAGAEGKSTMGYYFSNTPNRASFSQGIMQNVNITAGGVSTTYGFTQALTAGSVITDPAYVKTLAQKIKNGAEVAPKETLMPVFDENGLLVAYERSVDPDEQARVTTNANLHQMIGVWRGRQVEEALAGAINDQLVNNLDEMYRKDKAAGKEDEYTNIFQSKDKVLADAVRLLPQDVRDTMQNLSGDDGVFMVRRDMVFDAVGYRAASIGDAWTGNTRFDKTTQDTVKRLAMAAMGNKAYATLVNAEKTLSNFMGDARTMIVVKSLIVPAGNLVSNMVQLTMRGVPLKDILRKSVTVTQEVEAYVKNRQRQVAAEAELRAAVSTNAKAKLEAEIQSLKDAQKRLTIWPLIEAGEFTAISDVGVVHDDLDLSQGKWQEFIERQVDRLPDAVRNAGRYAVITKDTALFKGLEKAVQYGDFVAKAIQYQDLVGRQGKKPAEAMAKITEEFVNYDRLPGRTRGYLEQIGLLWFYNYKLRMMKVAAAIIRENPLHALLTSALPMPSLVGTPFSDNALTKLAEGTLGYSMGPGMGLAAPSLNPWYNLTH